MQRLAAQQLFSQSFDSAGKRLEEGLHFIQGATPSAPGRLRQVQTWFEDCFQSVSDCINNPPPEEVRKRKFMRYTLPKLEQGSYFTLVQAVAQDGNMVSKLSQSVFSLVGQTNASSEESTILLCLSELKLKWSTMELVRNKPKASGVVALNKVKDVKSNGADIMVLDSSSNPILTVRAESNGEAEEWAKMLLSALSILQDEIEDSNRAESGALYKQKRLLELERRRREREKQKRALDSKIGAKGYQK